MDSYYCCTLLFTTSFREVDARNCPSYNAGKIIKNFILNTKFFLSVPGWSCFPSISPSHYTEALLLYIDSHPIKFRGCLCFCQYQNTTWLCNTVVIRHTICSVITYCSFKGYLCPKSFMFVLLQGLLWYCAWGSYFYWCVMSYLHQKLTTLLVDAWKKEIKIWRWIIQLLYCTFSGIAFVTSQQRNMESLTEKGRTIWVEVIPLCIYIITLLPSTQLQ